MTAVNVNSELIEKIAHGTGSIGGDLSKVFAEVTANEKRISALENAAKPPSSADLSLIENKVDINKKAIEDINKEIPLIKHQVGLNMNKIDTVALEMATVKKNSDDSILKVDALEIKTSRMQNELTHAIDVANSAQTNASSALGASSANTANIATMSLDVAKNARDISKLKAGMAIYTDTRPAGQSGGTASSKAWTNRPVGHEVFNDIGVSLNVAKIKLTPGQYIIEAIATAEGENQARLLIGTTEMYGTVAGTTGCSEVNGFINITADTDLTLQTIVTTATGSDSLGKASPFGHEKIFSTIKIKKVD